MKQGVPGVELDRSLVGGPRLLECVGRKMEVSQLVLQRSVGWIEGGSLAESIDGLGGSLHALQDVGERTIVGCVVRSGFYGLLQRSDGAPGVPLQRKHLSDPIVTDVLIGMGSQCLPERCQGRIQPPLLQKFHAFLVEALTSRNFFIQVTGLLLQLSITIEGFTGLSESAGPPVGAAEKIVGLRSQPV